MSVSLLYRDEHLLVADKPAGLLSVADPSEPALVAVLAEQGIRAHAVHRLDRDVSGAIVLALTPEARERLEELFRGREVRKTYWALASGRVAPPSGKLSFPILDEPGGSRVSARGKPATTLYRTLESFPASTALEIELVTGRKNQVRVHLAHAGFPLVGERKYARGRDSAVRIRSRRVALHAWKIAFRHPITGEELAFEAPLPADLVELVGRARAPRSGEDRSGRTA